MGILYLEQGGVSGRGGGRRVDGDADRRTARSANKGRRLVMEIDAQSVTSGTDSESRPTERPGRW